MLTDKEREIYTALAAGNMSLASCLWNSWREKGHAYTQSGKPDPFEPIFKCADRILLADNIRLSVQDKLIRSAKDFDKKREA